MKKVLAAEGNIQSNLEEVQECLIGELGRCDEGNVDFSNRPNLGNLQNVQVKKDIKVADLEFGDCASEDGKAVKLHVEKVLENTKKLDKSLVVKIFSGDVPFSSISFELRKQWARYGKFHLTVLGKGWILCSFYEPEHMEAVLTNGPWFVNGNTVGIDRWTQRFDPNSLKGLSAPIWIRLPNLPLHCRNEINICRIASMVGKPYLIDGNMFQWSIREFGRVCVRIDLYAKLPTGVWVEGDGDKFFQRIEYERLTNLCFECGKIGHGKNDCAKVIMEDRVKYTRPVNSIYSNMVENGIAEGNQNLGREVLVEKEEYGPWMLVKYGKKKFNYNMPRRLVSRVESRSNFVTLKQSDKIKEVSKNKQLLIRILSGMICLVV